MNTVIRSFVALVVFVTGVVFAQNVGIGTAVPTERLHVSGNLRFDGALMPSGDAGTTGQVLMSQGPGVAPVWQTPRWGEMCVGVSANFVQKWTGTELCNSIIYDDGANVGIGTTMPSQKLHILNGATLIESQTSANARLLLRSSGQGSSSCEINLIDTVVTGGKGLTNHRIFGPFDAVPGVPGALYIGAGASADGTRNYIILYNLGCYVPSGPANCNALGIQLLADTTYM